MGYTVVKGRKKTDRLVEEAGPDAPGEAGRHAQDAQLMEEIIWQWCRGMKHSWRHMTSGCSCFKMVNGMKSMFKLFSYHVTLLQVGNKHQVDFS